MPSNEKYSGHKPINLFPGIKSLRTDDEARSLEVLLHLTIWRAALVEIANTRMHRISA